LNPNVLSNLAKAVKAVTIWVTAVLSKFAELLSVAAGKTKNLTQKHESQGQVNIFTIFTQSSYFTFILHVAKLRSCTFLNNRVSVAHRTAETLAIRRSATRSCEWCEI
jgi:hypothetical protein